MYSTINGATLRRFLGTIGLAISSWLKGKKELGETRLSAAPMLSIDVPYHIFYYLHSEDEDKKLCVIPDRTTSNKYLIRSPQYNLVYINLLAPMQRSPF